MPAVWAAPGAPAPDTAVTAAVRPAATREPEPRGHGGLRPIPLRPLNVLELIDGAIGAVRAVPAALLGWASLTVVAAALADFALSWAFNSAVATATHVHPVILTDDIGNTIVQFDRTSGAGTFGLVVVSALIPIVLSGFAVTILAGLLAEPVKRYVDGATLAASTSARQVRNLLRQLITIAVVTALPRAILLALYALVTLAVVNDSNGGLGGWFVAVTLLGLPLCAWLTAEWAIAAPIAALEHTSKSFAALGRARRLVARGRWRTLWATLLTLIIADVVVAPLLICAYYIGFHHGVHNLLKGNPVSGATYWWLAGYLVVLVLGQVLTALFRAAVATMLYVDRRFRREGLDIRIAWARVARGSGSGKSSSGKGR